MTQTSLEPFFALLHHLHRSQAEHTEHTEHTEYTEVEYVMSRSMSTPMPTPEDSGSPEWEPIGPTTQAWSWDDVTPADAQPELITDPLAQLPEAEADEYPLPPLEAGYVGIELDCPLDGLADDLSTWIDQEATHYLDAYDVHVHPVTDVGPSGVPVIRMSGFHENVRNALAQYFNGDLGLAAEAYRACVNVIGTGSVIGGVEARFNAYGGKLPEYRPNSETIDDRDRGDSPE
jgi:hypothetical protein